MFIKFGVKKVYKFKLSSVVVSKLFSTGIVIFYFDLSLLTHLIFRNENINFVLLRHYTTMANFIATLRIAARNCYASKATGSF